MDEKQKILNDPKYLKTGDKFIAVDKVGNEYMYEVLGINIKDLNHFQSIALWNLTMNNLTEVEYTWLLQRKITVVVKE